MCQVRILKENINKVQSHKLEEFKFMTQDKIDKFFYSKDYFIDKEIDNPIVQKLSKGNDFIKNSLASQIAEHRLIHNVDATTLEIKKMQEIAIKEQDLTKTLDKELKQDSSMQKFKNQDKENFENLQKTITNIARSRYRDIIKNNMDSNNKQMVITKHMEMQKHNNIMSKVKKDAIKQAAKMQQEFKKQEVELVRSRQMELTR